MIATAAVIVCLTVWRHAAVIVCGFVDQNDGAATGGAGRKPKLLLVLEGSSNPIVTRGYCENLSAGARGAGAVSVVDSTF